MKTRLLLLALLGLFMLPVNLTTVRAQDSLGDRISQLSEEAENLLTPAEKGLINQVSWKVARMYGQEGGLDVALLDLDNSTISQLAEVWFKAALLHYGIEDIRVVGGGLKAGQLNKEAILTLNDWGFVVLEGEGGDIPLMSVDYNKGQWNLFSKKIDPEKHADLILFVDDHCASSMHEDLLSRLEYVEMVLGTSPGCIEEGEYQFSAVNKEIGAKMFFLVQRLEVNLLQQKKIRKQRKDYFN